MSKKSSAGRRRRAHAATVACLALTVCLLITGTAGCRKSPDRDGNFFEVRLRTQATAAGESASLNTVDLSQVVGISYMPRILSSNRWQLESDRDREAFASLLTDVPFIRLTDGDTPADDPAVSERVQPIVEKGLLFSYTVRDRKTEGTVYIAPDGQACWFTSDGADVYLAEPGSVAYAEAQSLGFRLMYGDLLPEGIGTETAP